MKPLHSVLLLLATAPSATRADDYSGMLAYLDVARIDGHALAGANGAIAVNQAAGDLNVQANLRGIAKGDRADVAINARQLQQGSRVLSGSLQATAFIGGDALAGASGIASINQASGIANTTLNVVSATLARQGCDPARIRQAVLALLENARRHAIPCPLRVRVTLAEGHCTVTVEDGGPGVPDDLRDSIFEAFQRTDVSRSRQSGGSGLGLAVVRAIAVAHHGTARCRATERGGSAFEIRWPVHARR